MKLLTATYFAFACTLFCGATFATGTPNEAEIDFGIEDKTDAYVLETVTPKFPTEMLQRGIQGRTVLMLRVDEQGEVDNVRVITSSNELFSEAAIKSVKKWYFQPGTHHGKAVSQIVTVPVNFLIEDLQTPALANL